MKAYTVTWADENVLTRIAAIKSARLTGSFARGTPHNESDLDFRMKPEDVTAFARWLKETGRDFDSELPGHIAVDGIEIYDGFHRTARAQRMDSVSINGRTFRTW